MLIISSVARNRRKNVEEVELAIYDFYADYYQDKITVGDEQVKLAVIETVKKTLICKECFADGYDVFPRKRQVAFTRPFGNPAVRTLFKDKSLSLLPLPRTPTWRLTITEEELIAFRNNIDVQIDYYITRMGTVIADTTPTTSLLPLRG